MGTLATIIDKLYADIANQLSVAGYPPLVAGKILVGKAELFAQGAAPRVVFVPRGNRYVAPDFVRSFRNDDERRKMMSMPAESNVMQRIDIHCWAAANTGNAVDDYDVANDLCTAVRNAMARLLNAGSYTVECDADWSDETAVVAQGQELVLKMTIIGTSLLTLQPYDKSRLFAPDGVRPNVSDVMSVGSNTEDMC